MKKICRKKEEETEEVEGDRSKKQKKMKEADRGRTNERESRGWEENKKVGRLIRKILNSKECICQIRGGGKNRKFTSSLSLLSSSCWLLKFTLASLLYPTWDGQVPAKNVNNPGIWRRFFFSLSKNAWIIHPQIFLLLHKKYPVGSVNQGWIWRGTEQIIKSHLAEKGVWTNWWKSTSDRCNARHFTDTVNRIQEIRVTFESKLESQSNLKFESKLLQIFAVARSGWMHSATDMVILHTINQFQGSSGHLDFSVILIYVYTVQWPGRVGVLGADWGHSCNCQTRWTFMKTLETFGVWM